MQQVNKGGPSPEGMVTGREEGGQQAQYTPQKEADESELALFS
jgi:hypothetical protein